MYGIAEPVCAWKALRPIQRWLPALTFSLFAFCRWTSVACADPPEIQIPRAVGQRRPLTPDEQKRVNEAIERGVTFLRRTQLPNGCWIIGKYSEVRGRVDYAEYMPIGFAGLGGLALLESGVPAKDPAVQRAAHYVRKNVPGSFRTYEIALGILFLDRLAVAGDRALIRSLALRLAAGQTALGGWSYHNPLLTRAQEKKILAALSKKTRAELPRKLQPPSTKGRGEQADNSNTQFAILALWVARRYEVPLDWTLARAEQRFRLSQDRTGWDYRWTVQRRNRGYGTMACVGLLGLTAGRSIGSQEQKIEDETTSARREDARITWGLLALGAYMNDPTDFRYAGADEGWGPRGALNLYFLWSVERVGVLCNLDTIGGRDWYRWGVDLLLPTQRLDGSWVGRGSGCFPSADTSFALLFLKRSDLLPDLRRELAKRVKITDPGPLQASVANPKQKGKGPNLPKGIDTSPGEKAQPERPLEAALGDVKAGKATKLALRVRGPAPFRITGVRGSDDRLKIAHDALRKDVHELTLTLRPARAGEFTRTLILRTDLPGRPEVAVVVRARAAP